MSDPITIGAGLGAGLSILTGKNPLKGAAMGGFGGAGYGALTGSGWAGNLLSKGGMLTPTTAASTSPLGTGLMGNAEMISPFTPQGVAGVQTMTPGLTGAEPILGQAGQQAMAQSAPMYTGRQGMFDTMGGVSNTPGVSNAIMTGETVAGGGGYGALDRIKDTAKDFVSPVTQFAEENPRTTQVASQVALANMLQPQQQYQIPNPPPPPSPMPSKQSVAQFIPSGLMSQVQRNQAPQEIQVPGLRERLQQLYGY
jgi:hypothetical protein